MSLVKRKLGIFGSSRAADLSSRRVRYAKQVELTFQLRSSEYLMKYIHISFWEVILSY